MLPGYKNKIVCVEPMFGYDDYIFVSCGFDDPKFKIIIFCVTILFYFLYNYIVLSRLKAIKCTIWHGHCVVMP